MSKFAHLIAVDLQPNETQGQRWNRIRKSFQARKNLPTKIASDKRVLNEYTHRLRRADRAAQIRQERAESEN